MLKLIYAGTPEFALPALAALLAGPHRVVAVYTQPDRPAGRGRKLQASPVKRLALEHELPVFQPENFKSADPVDRLRRHDADLMIVAAYGLLLPPAVLAAPRLGCVNIHASLLPRWRGASPIQHALLAGDAETGISLMKMTEGLDCGDVLAQSRVAIEAGWSAAELHDALAPLGAEMLAAALGDVESLLAAARPQDEALATYAPRLSKAQAEVDWRKPAAELEREVRAYNPWPVSFTSLDGDNLRLWRATASESDAPGEPGEVVAHDRAGLLVRCGAGALRVSELQFAGRKRVDAAQARDFRDLAGCRLGRES